MKKIPLCLTLTLILTFPMFLYRANTVPQKKDQPHLEKHGKVTRLIVEGKPFIIRGGELGNSSFTSMEYMAPVWPKLKALNLNTVLAPVYWELIEPVEGKFDFDLYDQLIGEARKTACHPMHLHG